MERLSRELHALREWSETTARLELAYALTDGSDGGVLNALVSAASNPQNDDAGRTEAQYLLDRITSALSLEPVGQRGELLLLVDEELSELEVRGSRAPTREGRRGLYCVVRSGWLLGSFIVVRPLVEAGAEAQPTEPRAMGPAVGS